MANLTELSQAVSKALGTPRRATRAILEQFFAEVVARLDAGEDVSLIRFGEFYVRLQDFNRRYYVEKGVIAEGDEVDLRMTRFRFARTIRQRLNRIVPAGTLVPGEKRSVDYKTPAAPSKEERDRRARAGITLGDIVDRLNEEARRRA